MLAKTYNDVVMPSFMYGTAWKKDATTRLVELAVDSGFTGIDTANQLIHYSEALVGEALLALRKRGMARESLFLQTKFTSAGGQDHRTPYDRSADLTTQVRQSFQSSLEHLHTDVLDSYVLHGPMTRRGLTPGDWEVWAAIEELYQAKKTRIIGVSNVSSEQLALLCSKAKVKPMVVQNRCFAVMGWDHHVREICREQSILYQGFSLLTANQEFLGAPAIRAAAARLKTGIAQVIFKFSMQIGMVPLTGTTDPEHMRDDLGVEKLGPLTDEEMEAILTVGI
jgi:diketogulonate reductase-like aldo/keto reductase